MLGSTRLHLHLSRTFGNILRYGYLGCMNWKARPFQPSLCYFAVTSPHFKVGVLSEIWI